MTTSLTPIELEKLANRLSSDPEFFHICLGNSNPNRYDFHTYLKGDLSFHPSFRDPERSTDHPVFNPAYFEQAREQVLAKLENLPPEKDVRRYKDPRFSAMEAKESFIAKIKDCFYIPEVLLNPRTEVWSPLDSDPMPLYTARFFGCPFGSSIVYEMYYSPKLPWDSRSNHFVSYGLIVPKKGNQELHSVIIDNPKILVETFKRVFPYLTIGIEKLVIDKGYERIRKRTVFESLKKKIGRSY